MPFGSDGAGARSPSELRLTDASSHQRAADPQLTAMFERHHPLRKGGAVVTNRRRLRGCCGCHALPTQSDRGETDVETKGNAILDGNVPIS